MNATVIDTLRLANRLKDAGIKADQAEAMSRAFNDELTEGVATKQDLNNAVTALTGEIAKVDARLDAIDGKFEVKFQAVDARFDAVDAKMDARFDAMDAKMDARFGEVDAKFGEVDAKFDAMDAKFDAMDSRFDAIDSKFNAMDSKFNAMDSKFNALTGQFGTQSRYVFLVLALVVALGLYNAVSPHFIGRQPEAAATVQPASPVATPVEAGAGPGP